MFRPALQAGTVDPGTRTPNGIAVQFECTLFEGGIDFGYLVSVERKVPKQWNGLVANVGSGFHGPRFATKRLQVDLVYLRQKLP